MSTISHRPRRKRGSSLINGPDPVDAHVGARVKLRRTLLGLSQSDLATAVGLTFQQIQKYERAGNRISASMLYHVAEALNVPVSFFFDDMQDDQRLPPSTCPPVNDGRNRQRETLEVMRTYFSIPDDMRRPVYELIKSMARDDR